MRILIIPNPYIKTPKYKIKRLSKSEIPNGRNIESYKLIETPKIDIPILEEVPKFKKMEEPAVSQMMPQEPSPQPKKASKILEAIMDIFKTSKPKTTEPEQKKYKPYPHSYQGRGRRGVRGGGHYYNKKNTEN